MSEGKKYRVATNPFCSPPDHADEYGHALGWWRDISQMRRRDIALFSGGQGAAIIFVGRDIDLIGLDIWAVAVLAFLLALIGLNNEYRLASYMNAFRERAKDIERDSHGMLLVTTALADRDKLRFKFASQYVFQFYYLIIIVGWLLLFVLYLSNR